MRKKLYYVHDPMCSWCWGFKPVWDQVRGKIGPDVEIIYVVGGLAAETDEPMPEEMQGYLQETWRRIEKKTGVTFNHDFWRLNTPRRSTYPACKAVLVARRFGLELAMVEAIQRLYYQQAGNPSEYDSLYRLAEPLGIEREAFVEAIHSEAIAAQLQEEIMFAEQIGAQGFPSLICDDGETATLLPHSYTSVEENLSLIREHCLQR